MDSKEVAPDQLEVKQWISAIRSLFWMRMLKGLYGGNLFIDVDESSFNRSFKLNYSWLPRGGSHSILNSNSTERTSVMFGLWTNSQRISMTLDGTTKAEHFWFFVLLLENYMKVWCADSEFPLKVVLDNASVHFNKKTTKAAQFLQIQMYMLSPYCPHLAPVENIFGILLKSIWRSCVGKQIDFGINNGIRAIVAALKSIDQ